MSPEDTDLLVKPSTDETQSRSPRCYWLGLCCFFLGLSFTFCCCCCCFSISMPFGLTRQVKAVRAELWRLYLWDFLRSVRFQVFVAVVLFDMPRVAPITTFFLQARELFHSSQKSWVTPQTYLTKYLVLACLGKFLFFYPALIVLDQTAVGVWLFKISLNPAHIAVVWLRF